jgi:hypothetical protein
MYINERASKRESEHTREWTYEREDGNSNRASTRCQ